jgi:cytochrome P450
VAIVEMAELGADFYADPHPYYAGLREAGPVHEVRSPDGSRFWLVVGHEEARAALTDPRLSKSPPAVSPREWLVGKHVLTADPPDHTRLRKLVSREFTARRMESLRPRVQEITDRLLDAMVPAGRADLVGSLAFPLPMTVLCELLGVPGEDRADFSGWTGDILAPPRTAAMKAAAEAMFGYLDHLIDSKRHADPADDLLSALLRTNAEDDDRLSGQELRSMVFILLLAGHETTANLVSNGVRALLTHPDQLALLRADLSLIDAAVEEMLRFDGPVESASKRFTGQPVRYGGTLIPRGETVLVSLAAANRDPARFPAPGSFDIRRTTASGAGHLAFGHGIHFCLGAPLARIEGRIAIRTLLERCPGLAIDPDAGPFDWLPGIRIRGVRRLPVRW